MATQPAQIKAFNCGACKHFDEAQGTCRKRTEPWFYDNNYTVRKSVRPSDSAVGCAVFAFLEVEVETVAA